MTIKELKDLVPKIVRPDQVPDLLKFIDEKQAGSADAAVLDKTADEFAKQIDGPAALKLLELTKPVPAPAGASAATGAGPGASETEFDEFLTSLAQSVVATQKKLDRETAAYLNEIQGQAHIQPTVFRMPKLEAQMKFGLDVKSGRKLNLLFWGRNSETVQQNQQGINFEIVSVPAPPGAIESARRAVPQWTLTLDPLTRRDVMAEVIQIPANLQSAKDPLAPVVRAAAAAPADVVLVDVGDAARYLVFYAELGDTKDVGIWLLTRGSPGGPAKLDPVYRFTKDNGPGEPLMHQLVMDLAGKQRAFLGR